MSIVGTGRLQTRLMQDQDLLRTVRGQLGGNLRPLLADNVWSVLTSYTRQWMTDPKRRSSDLTTGQTVEKQYTADVKAELQDIFRTEIAWRHPSNAVAMASVKTDAELNEQAFFNFPVELQLLQSLGREGRVTLNVLAEIDRIASENPVRQLAILRPEQMASVVCAQGIRDALGVPDLKLIQAADVSDDSQRFNVEVPCVAFDARFVLPGGKLPEVDEPFPQARAFVVRSFRQGRQIRALAAAIRSYNQQVRIGNQREALAAIDTNVEALRQSRELEAINQEIDQTSEELREFLTKVQSDMREILLSEDKKGF